MKHYFSTRILFVILLTVLAGTAAAQLGIRTGFNLPRLGSEQAHVKTKMIFRYHLGLVMKGKSLSNSVELRPEILLSWKGQKYLYEETFLIGVNTRVIETEYKDKLTYLEYILPFYFNLNSKLSVEMGLYGGMRMSGKRKGETKVTDSGTYSKTDTYSEDARYGDKTIFPNGQYGVLSKRPLSTFDGGVTLGTRYMFTEKLGAALRYQFGFADIFRNNYPFENATKGIQNNQVIQISTILVLGR